MDSQHWDDMYRSRDQVLSGAPNGVLVTEVTDLAPGRALDVGCGEGADAHWPARHGWQVTAVDVSPTALRCAAAAAPDVEDRVTWTHADLTTSPPPAGAFDLVSAQCFPLARQPDRTALRGLLDAVAPGGTLLVVGHDLADLSPEHGHGFDPDAYCVPGGIARLLDRDWTALVNEIRPRTAPAPAGTHHTRDTVLRARRTPASSAAGGKEGRR
ncbi:class I SAM-dependent methyltransferase [Streptomyces sp. NPDC006274]|uniref:class I SAM-dependent methyltransferase n=1 Tax=unclassified Streptomyces TaxID=2593676 RepID=UPI0033A9E0AF